MFPGMNPRQLQKAMQKMGIQQQDIEADEVIIKTKDSQLIFSNPQVAKVNMMGQETYQIIGKPAVQPVSQEPDINEDDISTVMQQANCSKEKAVEAIKRHKGDLAQAILELKG